ncbi:MAG: hypothetical protein E6G92_10860 [Alphaproteobacteria bacterium]|nr:MAG: hypothetical protein E6G92_10860 [Alphaproteobacteria bacterium]
MIRALGMGLCLGMIAAAGAAQAPAPRFDGIWDLTWQTRHGPERRGYFVLRRQGSALRGQIHGQGSVTANGSIEGNGFVLRGSRMLVPYRIEGHVSGDRMEGALKVMSVDRRFTGVRRP